MMLSEKHRFLYCGAPKTGTHTMVNLLTLFGGTQVGGHHANTWDTPADFIWLGTVRNPWARLYSFFHMGRAKISNRKRPRKDMAIDTTLAEFIRFADKHRFTQRIDGYPYMPQHLFYTCRFTHFVRVEHFSEDFARLPFTGGIDLEIPKMHSGEWTTPISESYDDDAIEAAIAYGVLDECERFGYEKTPAPGGRAGARPNRKGH